MMSPMRRRRPSSIVLPTIGWLCLGISLSAQTSSTTPPVSLEAAIKTAGMTRSRDLKVVSGATLPAYDATAMVVSMRWKQLLGRVKLGGMAAGGAVVLGMSKGMPPIFVIVIAAAVAIGFVWLYFYKEEVDRCMVRARAEILPEVNRAFVDGRYEFPPLPAA